MENFPAFLTNFPLAVIILFFGFIIGKFFGRLIQKGLHEFDLDKLAKKAGIKASLEELISTIISYTIYFFSIIMALNRVGVTSALFNILGGAVIVVALIAFFLSVRDFIPNMMGGIYLHQKKMIKEGDTIKFRAIEGVVIETNLIETKVQTKSKDIIHIPNANFTKSEIFVKRQKESK